MKKIAVLMILVLCAVMLGGCMGASSGSSVANAVAFVKFSGNEFEAINLTVDKDGKVLSVTYGVDKVKENTVYKDSEIAGKALDEAVVEIIKVNEALTELTVNVISASGKETDEFKKVRDVSVGAAIDKAVTAEQSTFSLKITSGDAAVLEDSYQDGVSNTASDTSSDTSSETSSQEGSAE